jgi:glutamine amidotransferase
MIGIVDYGIGNLRSVEKAFEAIGAEAVVSSDRTRLDECGGLVLPGVGAFGDAMASLRRSKLDAAVERAAEDGRPLLGLCVGLQMLFEESEEFGRHAGLGLLPGRVVRFPDAVRVVPHTGWNGVDRERDHALLDGVDDGAYFYFVHSYRVEADDPADVVATTDYDGVRFPSICGRANVAGAQFHPEKSQRAGLRLVANFARLAEG